MVSCYTNRNHLILEMRGRRGQRGWHEKDTGTVDKYTCRHQEDIYGRYGHVLCRQTTYLNQSLYETPFDLISSLHHQEREEKRRETLDYFNQNQNHES